MAPSLAISLRDSGKSRADLWAFAAIVATEYGIETNNMLCDGTFNNNPEIQCSDRIGTNDCRINLSRSLKFQTGRKDCTSTGILCIYSYGHSLTYGYLINPMKMRSL